MNASAALQYEQMVGRFFLESHRPQWGPRRDPEPGREADSHDILCLWRFGACRGYFIMRNPDKLGRLDPAFIL